MIKLKDLYLILTKLETGKKQVNIAQMREIVKCIAIIIVKEPSTLIELWRLGLKHTGKVKK